MVTTQHPISMEPDKSWKTVGLGRVCRFVGGVFPTMFCMDLATT